MKQVKVGSAQEIEELTGMFSKASQNLICTTIANRELQKKFDAYFQQSDTYIKECELKISHLEIEVKTVREQYAAFDVRFKEKEAICNQLETSKVEQDAELDELKKLSKK